MMNLLSSLVLASIVVSAQATYKGLGYLLSQQCPGLMTSAADSNIQIRRVVFNLIDNKYRNVAQEKESELQPEYEYEYEMMSRDLGLFSKTLQNSKLDLNKAMVNVIYNDVTRQTTQGEKEKERSHYMTMQGDQFARCMASLSSDLKGSRLQMNRVIVNVISNDMRSFSDKPMSPSAYFRSRSQMMYPEFQVAATGSALKLNRVILNLVVNRCGEDKTFQKEIEGRNEAEVRRELGLFLQDSKLRIQRAFINVIVNRVDEDFMRGKSEKEYEKERDFARIFTFATRDAPSILKLDRVAINILAPQTTF